MSETQQLVPGLLAGLILFGLWLALLIARIVEGLRR